MIELGLDKESRLFPAWFPLLLLAIFLCLLVVLFPRNLERTISLSKPDQVSVAYLRAMLKREPQNRVLREHLIAHYSQLGKTDRALYELSDLMLGEGDSELKIWQVELLQFQFFKLVEGNLERQNIRVKILGLLTVVLIDKQLDSVQLERLGAICQNLGWYELVAEIYQRLAKQATVQPQSTLGFDLLPVLLNFFLAPVYAQEITQAERYALKSLDGLVATGVSGAEGVEKLEQLLQLLPHSETLLLRLITLAQRWGEVHQARDWGRRYLANFEPTSHAFKEQLKLELAANEANSSMSWIKGLLDRLSNNIELLNISIPLSLASGDPMMAKLWGRKRLLLDPNNAEFHFRQIELELGSGDIKGALRESLLLLKRQPNNRELRRRTAQFSEWSDDFETALFHWMFLAKLDPLSSDADHSLLLAKQLSSHRSVVNLLLWKSQQQQLSKFDLQELRVRSQLLNNPKETINILQRLRHKYPQQHVIYEQLLTVYQAQDNLRDALSLLLDMESRFGVVINDFMIRARLLVDLGKAGQAFKLLHDVKNKVADTKYEFWHLYADLAFQVKNKQQAKQSYALLKNKNKINMYESYRYLMLLRSDLTAEKTIRLSEGLWHQFGEPSFLLIALDVAYNNGFWGELDRLLSGEEILYKALLDHAQYWAIKSYLAQHNGDFLQAKNSLQRAVDLNPVYQTDFFWFVMNYGEKKDLRFLLSELSQEAIGRVDLWPVMVAAYTNLKKPKEALVWYQKILYQQNNNSDELIFYGDVFKQAGYKTQSDHILRQAVSRIQKNLFFSKDPLSVDKLNLLLRYFGREVAERSLRTQLFLGLGSQKLQATAVNWYWSQGDRLKAQYWWYRQNLAEEKQPVYMRLASALEAGERGAVEALVLEEGSLTLMDKVFALRDIGADGQALDLALNAVPEHFSTVSEVELDQQISELLVRMPTGGAIRLKQKQSADYSLLDLVTQAVASSGPDTLIVKASQNRIGLVSDVDVMWLFEVQFGVTLQHRWQSKAETEMTFGQLKRSVSKKAQFFIQHQQRKVRRWFYKAQMSFSATGDESLLFRTLGLKDHLSVFAQWELGAFHFVSIELEAHRYQTRLNERLGRGWGGGLLWGQRWSLHPKIQSTIYVNGIENKLVLNLPQSLQNTIASGINVLLADRNSVLGVNVLLQEGVESFWGHRHAGLFYKLEAGAFSSNSYIGYRFNAALGGVRVFGKDDVSVKLSYSDSIKGVDTNSSAVIEGRYSYSFD